jgi:pimeloyl-ACP methyl ester carboxylesterase
LPGRNPNGTRITAFSPHRAPDPYISIAVRLVANFPSQEDHMMRSASPLVLAVAAMSISFVRAEGPADALDKAPSKFAKSGDLKVHYKSLGEGKTGVVFIHGWCCDHSVWRDQAAAFDGNARMVFIDLPGYGKSDKPKIDYTMEVFAKGVDAVLQDAGVEQAVLAGHSMGTPVVRQFYRLFPAKTKALVFVDGGLRRMFKDPKQAEGLLARFKEESFKEDAPKFLTAMLPPSTPTAVRERLAEIAGNATPQVAISSMRNMFMDDKIWTEDPIKTPALALMAKSPFWTDDYKEYVKKLAPELEYREFDGVGHFLFMENPKEFNAALGEFLKKQSVLK